jgi:hypothetical protein
MKTVLSDLYYYTGKAMKKTIGFLYRESIGNHENVT